MNKIISKAKELLPLIMLVFALVLIFVPLPIMLIQVLLVLDTAFSLCLFLSKFFNSTAIAYHFLRLVIYNSIYTCGIAIATTRTFLSIENLNDHIPLVLNIGRWICRDNYVCGFFTTLLFSSAILMYCHLHVQKCQELAARFCLDMMNQKLFYIDRQVEQKQITIEEGEIEKRKVQLDIDYHSSMDGSSKFLEGAVVALAVLFVIATGGGVAVGILDMNLFWKDSLNQYIMLSSGYLVLFVVPLFLTSLSFKINKLE